MFLRPTSEALENRLPDYDKRTKFNTYRGDLKVRKFNTRTDSLPPEYEDEWIRCSMDPIYFICKYVKTKSLDSSDHIYFDLHDHQIELINMVVGNRLSVAMMARQMGKTVAIIALMLWYMIFNNNFKTEVVSYIEKDAKKALKLYKDMYERLPFWMQHGVETWGTLQVILDNGSSIDAKSANGTRGGSLNFLYIDELSFIENGEDFWASVYPTIESGKSAKIAITSTPRGMNFFHTLWVEHDIRGFARIEKPYWAHPDRNNDAYIARTRAAVGPRIWIQEYECKFEGSSDTLVSGNGLARLKHKVAELFIDDGFIQEKVFEEPVDGGLYITTADTSEGVGGDFSAFHTIRVDVFPIRVVHSFSTNLIDPRRYAYRIYDSAQNYNMAWIIAENNSIGYTTVDTLVDTIKYPHIIYTNNDANDEKGEYRAGVRMTVKSKSIGCTNLKVLVESGLIDLNDLDTIKEFFTFEKKGKGFSAIHGKNDDRVMSLVNFAAVIRTPEVKQRMSPDFDAIFEKCISKAVDDDVAIRSSLLKNKDKELPPVAQSTQIVRAAVERTPINESHENHTPSEDYASTMKSMFS